MKKLSSIHIRHLCDKSPDFFFLGHYSDQWQNGAIERVSDGMIEDDGYIEDVEQQKQSDVLTAGTLIGPV